MFVVVETEGRARGWSEPAAVRGPHEGQSARHQHHCGRTGHGAVLQVS